MVSGARVIRLVVVDLVAEGLSNTDIATRMQLSTGTVKDSAILTKLGVGSRVPAALPPEQAGLLRRPSDQELG